MENVSVFDGKVGQRDTKDVPNINYMNKSNSIETKNNTKGMFECAFFKVIMLY